MRGLTRAQTDSQSHEDKSLMVYRGHRVQQTLIRSYFSPRESTGQRYIYTGSYNGRVYVYDVLTGKPVQVIVGHRAVVRDVSWHPHQPVLASTSWDRTVGIWAHRQGAPQRTVEHAAQRPVFDDDDDGDDGESD